MRLKFPPKEPVVEENGIHLFLAFEILMRPGPSHDIRASQNPLINRSEVVWFSFGLDAPALEYTVANKRQRHSLVLVLALDAPSYFPAKHIILNIIAFKW